MGFAQFMASKNGRALRIVAGLAIIAGGVLLGGTAGTIIAIVGIVPLAAGIFDVCIFGPILVGRFRGADIRAK
jgi:Inner membrane protein YgaP-like, transmembrane domain